MFGFSLSLAVTASAVKMNTGTWRTLAHNDDADDKGKQIEEMSKNEREEMSKRKTKINRCN